MLGFLRRSKQFKYRRCPNCRALAWESRGSGEIVDRWGRLYIRQYHKCLNCGLRMRLVRKMDSNTWSCTEYDATLS